MSDISSALVVFCCCVSETVASVRRRTGVVVGGDGGRGIGDTDTNNPLKKVFMNKPNYRHKWGGFHAAW